MGLYNTHHYNKKWESWRHQKVNKDSVQETSLVKTFQDASQEAHTTDQGAIENVTLVWWLMGYKSSGRRDIVV